MEFDHEMILRTFLAETEENLAAVEEALVELEGRPDDEEALGTIFRAAHTLKGDATSFGFVGVAALAHSMEDVLDRLRSHAMPVTSDLVTTLLQSVDVLRRMVPAAARGEAPEDSEASRLITALDALAGGNVEPSPSGRTPALFHRDVEPERTMSERSQKRTLRVDAIKLDQMLNLITEIVIARGRLEKVIGADAPGAQAVLEAFHASDALYKDLQELIMGARMVPIEATFRSYIRVVRDLAHQSGKLARIEIDAQGVEVDTRIAEHVRDPLTHMIRNAIDHGIEAPERRDALGKDPTGVVKLRARHEAGTIVVQVIDDGAGLDRAAIARRAAAMRLAPDPESLPDADLFRLILEPGFSTAPEVSTISGRGIGMDVVRRNVEAVRGSLRIDSERGRGTSITIRLPLTLAIIDGFGIGVGDETYVIPLDAVRECVELPAEESDRKAVQGVMQLRGEVLPYVRLRSLLSLESLGAAQTEKAEKAERQSVVVVQTEGSRAGIVVDALYGKAQTVIKPLGRLFSGVEEISGSAVLSDGRVALILDVPALLRRTLTQGGAPSRAAG